MPKNIILRIRGIAGTDTIKNSSVTTTATIINGILGLAFYVILARILGPAAFGIFSLTVAALSIISDIANVGTDTGIINFVSRWRSSDPDKAKKILKLGLTTKIVASFLIICIGWFLVPWAAEILLKKPELTSALRLALIGASTQLLFSFATSALQAYERFIHWGVLNILMNLLRLLIVVSLIVLLKLGLTSSLIVYITIPALGFLVALKSLPNFLSTKKESSVAKEFFKYNKWIALSVVFSSVSARLDTLVTARLMSLAELGVYSVAVNLAAVVPQIVFAIASVAAPKLTQFKNIKQAKVYLSKLQIMVIVLALLGIAIGIPLATIIIPLFYGTSYLPSIIPFIVLLLAQAVFLISIPVHTSIFYYFGKPAIFTLLSMLQIALILIITPYLITNYGYLGAASSVLVANLLNFIVPGIWVIWQFKKQK